MSEQSEQCNCLLLDESSFADKILDDLLGSVMFI